MRVALLGITHETNTFSPVVTDYAKFVADGSLLGDEIVAKHGTARSMLAGFLSTAEASDVDLVPLAWAWANPSGTVTAEAFERLCDEQLALLEESGPWDAVFMAQHGAGVSENHPDLDAEFVRRVRGRVGEAVPIGVALDLHSNVGQGLIDAATIVVGFKTNPHIDAYETARACGLLTLDVARGTPPPTMTFRRIDAVINILRHATDEEPMASIIARVREIESRPGVLSATVFQGYPYADVEDLGMSCVVVGDADAARLACAELADLIWASRGGFMGEAMAPAEAVRLRSDEGPVVLLDVGDNIGGGGDGRSTTLLAGMLAARVGRTATIVQDPRAAAECVDAGVGARVAVDVGRPALQLEGTVRRITDGVYEDPQSTHGGYRFFDSGTTCVLELDNEDIVILTSKVTLPITLEQLRSVGVEPGSRRMIVAKGVLSPQPAYGSIAGRMVVVDTPGVTTCDLDSLPYVNRRRPLYPFEMTSLSPETTAPTGVTA